MDKAGIELEARLIAIEHMLANAFRLLYQLAGATEQQIKATHDRARESLSKETIPGADPASSDLGAGEIQDAVCDLLALIEAEVKSGSIRG